MSQVKKQSKLTSFFTTSVRQSTTPVAAKKQEAIVETGSRLRIYWKDDDAWYEGEVRSRAGNKHEVLYDDGEREMVDLSLEKYEYISGGKGKESVSRAERNRLEALKRRREREEKQQVTVTKGSEIEYSDEIELAPKKSHSLKKRRILIDDDEDYEDESSAHESVDNENYGLTKSSQSKRQIFPRESTSSQKSRLLKDVVGVDDEKEGSCFVPNDYIHQDQTTIMSDEDLKNLVASRKTASISSQRTSGLQSSVDEAAESVGKVGVYPRGSHTHDIDPKYTILTKPRDMNGNAPGEAEYDRRTMRLGSVASWEKSQVQLQWWQIKQKYADCLLFFKIGRFYEMYHTDADTGVDEAGLVYMKGEQAHAGFPEPAYGKYLDILIKKGYKVARVEQTERPEENKARIAKMKSRGQKPTEAQKAMRREVCSLVTPGTRCYTYLEKATMAESSSAAVVSSEKEFSETMYDHNEAPQWLAAVIERGNRLGICFADCARGVFVLAEFDDDPLTWARLRTALQSFPVVEVLLERGDTRLADLVATASRDTLRADMNLEVLAPETEFWTLEKSIHALKETQPKPSKKNTDETKHEKEYYIRWPEVLRRAVEGNATLCLSALGAITFWLRRSLIDVELLSMGNFEAYAPSDLVKRSSQTVTTGLCCQLAADEALLIAAAADLISDYSMDQAVSEAKRGKRMALDATALKNLEILKSTHSDKVSGSLWGLFSKYLSTAMGRRLMRQWLSKPLFEVNDVKTRTDAVEELLSQKHKADALSKKLKKVPDLDRLLQQLHTLGSARRAPLPDDFGLEQHPDSRAVLFDALKFQGKKVQQLIDALRGLKACEEAVKHFRPDSDEEDHATGTQWKSVLLRRCVEPLAEDKDFQQQHNKNTIGGCFPELRSHLAAFESGFDLEAARKTGVLEARRGSDDAYDKACDDQSDLENDLNAWLLAMRKETRLPKLEYVTSARDRYQVKVPEEGFSSGRYFAKTLPKGWTQKNKSKKHRTFVVPQVEAMVKQLEDAENRRNQAKLDQLRSLFSAFDKRRARWHAAITCVATLDALLAMARCSRRSDFCRADYADSFTETASPYLSMTEGKHPALDEGLRFTDDVIGNDLCLGGKSAPPLLLLSGPNMGGKSTLLRQVCLNAILAQLGCYVRAESLQLTPVDRVFTRLGASDRIMHNQSTFMLELAETADILHHATSQSLCILDELGRGTATFDGVAIAHSVVSELAIHTKCRALFSTHYHDLIREWSHHPTVQLGHMDCIVELPSEHAHSTNTDAQHADGHTITFLYKLVPGLSPRSFGINVARLAKLPHDIIQRAIEKSNEFDQRLHQRLNTQDAQMDTDA